MLLGLIFSILTATFSLSSTTEIKCSGDIPTNATYYYERTASTGQKGQMTAGNSTRLCLTGWEGCTIQSICLRMRSNSQSGAGSLLVKIGGIPQWILEDISFADTLWAGTFSTDWVDITRKKKIPVQGDIEILISANENSLYIDSYTITYEPSSPRCHTVAFTTGLDIAPPPITQSYIGEAITLPAWQDTTIWHFMGWSEKELAEDSVPTHLLAPGTTYIPQADCRLWAVYSDHPDIEATTNYLSGEYIITCHNLSTQSFTGSGAGMHGVIKDSEVGLSTVIMNKNTDNKYILQSAITDDMIYNLIFAEDSTLSIVHHLSGTPIGYKNNKLYPTASTWRYKVLSDGSLVIYYVYQKNTYTLYFESNPATIEDKLVAYSRLVDIGLWEHDGMWLFPIIDRTFTSWPFGKFNAVDTIESTPSEEEYIIPWGVYKLYIKDGKKYLVL